MRQYTWIDVIEGGTAQVCLAKELSYGQFREFAELDELDESGEEKFSSILAMVGGAILDVRGDWSELHPRLSTDQEWPVEAADRMKLLQRIPIQATVKLFDQAVKLYKIKADEAEALGNSPEA